MAVLQAFNASVNAAAQGTFDLDVRQQRRLTVVWTLKATTTPADLTLNDAIPYDANGALLTVGLPVMASSSAASDGVNVVAVKQYDVSGFDKVRLRGQNNNVGAKTLVIDVAMEGRS